MFIARLLSSLRVRITCFFLSFLCFLFPLSLSHPTFSIILSLLLLLYSNRSPSLSLTLTSHLYLSLPSPPLLFSLFPSLLSHLCPSHPFFPRHPKLSILFFISPSLSSISRFPCPLNTFLLSCCCCELYPVVMVEQARPSKN